MGMPADQRAGRNPRKPISAGASPSAAARVASSAGAPISAGSCGNANRALPWPAPRASSVQRTGPIPSCSTNSWPGPPPSRRPSSTAVPTVGWPANGSSRAGVKMRTRARWLASPGGRTKTVSGWLNSRAIACIDASSMPSPSSTTASGLPAKRRSVNTSRVANRRCIDVLSAARIQADAGPDARPPYARTVGDRRAGRSFGVGSLSDSSRKVPIKSGAERASKPLDQAGVDQQPIEASRLRAAGAAVEQSLAALQNFFLLGERRVERQPGRLLHDQREIGPLDGVERGAEVDRFEVDRIDRVIGREIARIIIQQPAVDCRLLEPGLENGGGEIRLVVAVGQQQERLARKVAPGSFEQVRIIVKAHGLPLQIFVDRGGISRILPFRQQIRPPAGVPGIMVGGEIDEQEHRALAAPALDHPPRGVVVEPIGLDAVGAERALVEKFLHADGGLEALRAHEGAERRIDRVGP